MLGLMQRHPLLLSSIIAHAARHHAEAELVSTLPDGGLHRSTHAAAERRSRRLMDVPPGCRRSGSARRSTSRRRAS